MTNNIFLTRFVGVSIIAVAMAFASVAYAAAMPVANEVSCTMTISSSTITNAQTATLHWDSTEGALFAELDNGIGSVAVDGEMIVSPSKSTVYTLHVWNAQGNGGYCSVALSVQGGATASSSVNTATQPTVSARTLVVHRASKRVSLGNVPYTGPVENAVYTLFLVALMLTAGYVVKSQRKYVFS